MKIMIQVRDFLVPHLDLLKDYADGPLEFTFVRDDADNLISSWHDLSPVYHAASICMSQEEYSSRVSFAKDIKADYFSLAIGHPCEAYKLSMTTGKKVADSKPLSRKQFLGLSKKRLSSLKKHFRYVSAENLDYNEGGLGEISAYELEDRERITTPEFVTEFVKEMGVDLLLDIGHAQVSAKWEKLSDEEYLFRLPLEKTYEVHFNRPTKMNGTLRDTHHPPTEYGYSLLERVLSVANPEYITLELKTDFRTYLNELKRLRKWLDKNDFNNNNCIQ